MTTPPSDAETKARARFMLLNLIRFSGVLIAFAGAAIIGKRLIEPAETIGGLLLALGAFEVLILPTMLIRSWRGASDR